MENFGILGLPERLMNSLKLMKFHQPTPIQAQTIPSALEGKDILGSAQTGTGKTAAYGIPLIAHVLAGGDRSALVLTPTRELAMQVLDTLHQLLGKGSDVKTALLIGGDPITKQFRRLEAKPRIVVGTPGRIVDHLSRKTLSLADTTFWVLDEMDRMLDMGFAEQLQDIIPHLPEKRQTLMFSATMEPAIVKAANAYLSDPVRIAVGSTTSPVAGITQEALRTLESEKYAVLQDLLGKRQGTIIVFVKTRFNADRLAERLKEDDHAVAAIHGDLRQARRERVIRDFRSGKSRVLVATDVAARGLDIPHIECVVNYDLPQCPEDYIHRIGRTGRAGARGHAISMITGSDNARWRAISQLMKSNGGEAIRIEGAPAVTVEPRLERKPASSPSFAPRRERTYGERPQGDRPYGERPQGERRFERRERQGGQHERKPFSGGGFKKDRFQKTFTPRHQNDSFVPHNRREHSPFERDMQALSTSERRPFGAQGARPGRPEWRSEGSFHGNNHGAKRGGGFGGGSFFEKRGNGEGRPMRGERPQFGAFGRSGNGTNPHKRREHFSDRPTYGDNPFGREQAAFGRRMNKRRRDEDDTTRE